MALLDFLLGLLVSFSFAQSEEMLPSFHDLPRETEKNIADSIPKEETVLDIWLYEEEEATFAWSIQTFERYLPQIDVHVQTYVDPALALQKLRTDEAPDIILLESGWMEDRDKRFVPAPATLFTPEECASWYFAFTCAAFTDGQYIYGLPLFMENTVLFVNRDLLRDDRVTVGDRLPKTWKEMLAVNKLFRQFSSDGVSFSGWNSNTVSPSLGDFFLSLSTQTETLEEENIEEFLAVLNLLSQDNGYRIAKERFLRGDSAFFLGDQRMQRELLRVLRDPQQDELQTDAIWIYPVPQFSLGAPIVPSRSYGFAVPKKAQHPELAWAFLAFLHEPENNEAILTKMEATPSRRYLPRDDLFYLSGSYGKTPAFAGMIAFEETFLHTMEALWDEEMTTSEAAQTLFTLFFPQ